MSGGRIRSIKPEILDDATTAGLTSDAFRLFIGCIVIADDYGRLRADPAWLGGQVFWKRLPTLARDSRDLRETLATLLDELATARLLVLYAKEGQSYAQIRTWGTHQKVDHPGKARIPAPSDDDMAALARSSRDSREILAPDPDQDQDHRSGSGPPITDLRESPPANGVRGTKIRAGWRPAPSTAATIRSKYRVDPYASVARFIEYWSSPRAKNGGYVKLWERAYLNWVKIEIDDGVLTQAPMASASAPVGPYVDKSKALGELFASTPAKIPLAGEG